MMSLMQLEWLRLKGFRFFWIFLVGYFACLFMVMWVGKSLATEMLSGVSLPGMSSFSFSQTMSLIFYFSGFFESFLALILIMLISNDYGLGTLKQHVIDGLSYEQVTLGRLIQVSVLVVLSFLMVFGLSIVFAGQMSGEGMVWPSTPQVIGFFLRSLGNLSFAVLLVTIMQRAIPTVMVYIGYRFILEPAFGFGMGRYLEKEISSYLPLEVFGSLVESPTNILKLNDMMGSQADLGAQLPQFPPIYLGLLYFLLIWGAIYALIKTRQFQ